MNCKEDNCCCESMCNLFGCILNNPLVADDHKYLHTWVATQKTKKAKEKMVITILQEKQPPKVKGTQINNYFKLKREQGIDMDKDEVPAKIKIAHRDGRKIKIKQPNSPKQKKEGKKKSKEEKGSILFGGKLCPLIGFIDKHLAYPANIKQYSPVYLNEESGFHVISIRGDFRGYHPDVLGKHIKPYYPNQKNTGSHIKKHKDDAADVHLSMNRNTRINYFSEVDEYLQNQTPEQLAIAKLHGWKIAKILTAPEENFHEED